MTDVGAPPLPVTVVVTVASVSPAVALGVFGAAGTAKGAGALPVGVALVVALPLSPPLLEAFTANEYVVSLVRLEMVQVPDKGLPLSTEAVHVPLVPGLVSVTTKDVGVPPVAVSVMVKATAALLAVAVTLGVLGGLGRGVTDDEADDALLVP